MLQCIAPGLFLYRNILPTGLPNVAFVGAEVSTFNNILTQVCTLLEYISIRRHGKVGTASWILLHTFLYY